MHDFMLEMERERRGRLLEEARMSRMRKSLRRRKPGLAKTGTKERKRNV